MSFTTKEKPTEIPPIIFKATVEKTKLGTQTHYEFGDETREMVEDALKICGPLRRKCFMRHYRSGRLTTEHIEQLIREVIS